jgi:hypothetical protein
MPRAAFRDRVRLSPECLQFAGRLARTFGFKLPFAIIFLVLAQRNQTSRAMVVVRSGGTAGEEEGRT